VSSSKARLSTAILIVEQRRKTGENHFHEGRSAGKINHPGGRGVSSLMGLRNVRICHCQTFNVFIIPLLVLEAGRFSTPSQKTRDQNCSLKRLNCDVQPHLCSRVGTLRYHLCQRISLDYGAAGGIFPPTRGVLNPPRRLHLPGSLFGTLQACTLPSYATAATRETGSRRGICKFADPSYQDLVLV